jgi:hypothetical protein
MDVCRVGFGVWWVGKLICLGAAFRLIAGSNVLLQPSLLCVFWYVFFAIWFLLGRVSLKLRQYWMRKKSYDIAAVSTLSAFLFVYLFSSFYLTTAKKRKLKSIARNAKLGIVLKKPFLGCRKISLPIQNRWNR